MNGKVLIMCASRGRPHRLAKMVHSVEQTSINADIVVYVDDDQAKDYEDVPGDFKMIVGPRMGQCRSLNHIWRKCPGYEVYGAATDDCLFDTPRWDEWVLEAKKSFRGGIGLIAPYSDSAVPRMDFPWATAEWVDVMGSFCLLDTHHSYWDVALQLVGEGADAIKFAGPRDFKMWHEKLATGDMNDQSLGDIGKVMYNIYHIHNDARTAIVWAALYRHEAIEKVKAAAAKYDRSPDGVLLS